jgi:Family of unknown function (DUF6328)
MSSTTPSKSEQAGSGRDESEQERLDRNLTEMLGELRVALPGVQVLFAFLLVVPFNQRFPEITTFQTTVYFVTLLLATVATAFLIGPVVHHRIQFREQDKERIVLTANRYAVIGLCFLAAAMTGSILLITDLLYRSTTVTIVAGAVALMFLVLWYAVPLRRSLQNP